MVVMLALASSYAAYQAYQQQQQGGGTGDSDLEDGSSLTVVELLPLELELSLFEGAISTITYFEGNYQDVRTHLEARLDEITLRNRWLRGWIAKRKGQERIQLVFRGSGGDGGSDKAPTTGTNPGEGEAKMDEGLPRADEDEAKPSEADGADEPNEQGNADVGLDKQSQKNEDQVAMSDPKPMKQVLWCFEPGEIKLSRDTPYQALVSMLKAHPCLVPRSIDIVNKPQESLFRVSIIPDEQAPDERYALVVSLSHVLGDAHTFYKVYNMLNAVSTEDERSDSCGDGDLLLPIMSPHRKHEYMQHVEGVLGVKEAHYIKYCLQHNPGWSSWFSKTNKDDPMQARLVIVSQKWIDAQKQKCGALKTAAQMTGKRSSAVPFLSPREDVSSNSIITSYFFSLVQATVGLLVVNFCGRIPYILDTDAGNYSVAIPYSKLDYQVPEYIELSLETGQRMTHGVNELEGHLPEATYSVSVNWSKWLWKELKLSAADGSTGKEILHLPLYDGQIVQKMINNMSFINVFTASAGVDGDDTKRRLGAYILAPRSVVEQVDASGMVEQRLDTNAPLVGSDPS